MVAVAVPVAVVVISADVAEAAIVMIIIVEAVTIAVTVEAAEATGGKDVTTREMINISFRFYREQSIRERERENMSK